MQFQKLHKSEGCPFSKLLLASYSHILDLILFILHVCILLYLAVLILGSVILNPRIVGTVGEEETFLYPQGFF